MRSPKKFNFKSILVVLLSPLIFFSFTGWLQADHLTPERVVDNTYTVILLMIPQGEQMKLQFVFRDVHTGKNISDPITYKIVISEELSRDTLHARMGTTDNGIVEFLYAFPRGGLYDAVLEFEESGKAYRPHAWTLWVPGVTENFFHRKKKRIF